MISTLKNWLGIEGVKVSVEYNEAFSIENQSFRGQVVLSSMTAQHVESVILKVEELYSRGWRKTKLTDKYTLGELKLNVDKRLDANETISIPFTIGYNAVKSPIDKMADKNILNKGVSKIAKILKNVDSEYSILVVVKVKGVGLDPFIKVALSQK